jgi:hypothetical protein
MVFRTNGEYVPTGISGDVTLGHESGSVEVIEASLAQAAYYADIADRLAKATATPDEVATLEARLLAALQAHGELY